MPDLSRSCWRKIICKNITEDMKGRLLCGFQPGCLLTLLLQEGCYSAPCPRSFSPASSGSCSTGSGTPPARGGHCHLSGEQSVKEKAAAKGGGVKAMPSDPSHSRKEKPGHLACPISPQNIPFLYCSISKIRACNSVGKV